MTWKSMAKQHVWKQARPVPAVAQPTLVTPNGICHDLMPRRAHATGVLTFVFLRRCRRVRTVV
jgi:hypothetical protein